MASSLVVSTTPLPVSASASDRYSTISVFHGGGTVVYYGGPNVTSVSNTGSLTVGQSLTLTSPTWFVAAGTASLEITETPGSIGTSTSAAVVLPFNGRGTPGFARTQRAFSSGVSAAAPGQRTYRTKHAAQFAGTQLRFVYHNMSLDNGGPTNSISIRASYETPLATPYPATFNGGRDITIEPNQFVVTDPFGLTVATADAVWSRAAVTVPVPASDKVPIGALYALAANNEGYIDGDGTLTASPVLTASAFMYGPVAVLIEKPTSSYRNVAVYGDSLATGSGETSAVGGGAGFVGRALDSTNIGYLMVARGGDSLNGTVARNAFARLVRYKLVVGFSNALIHYGTNDRNSGRTNAQMQADLQTLCVDLKAQGMRVLVCTIPPRTTSTDAFATDGLQTPVAGEAERLLFNAFLRTAPLPAWIDVVFDTAVTVESVTNPGNWKGGYTTDGIHPIAVGHTAMAAVIDTTKFA